MGEVEGVPRSPPAPRTYDSELFDAYDEAAFQTHANHAMEARLNLHVSGRSGDEIDDFKLPPIQPRRCLSPTSVGHTQSTIKRQAQNSQKPKSKVSFYLPQVQSRRNINLAFKHFKIILKKLNTCLIVYFHLWLIS